MLFLLLNVHHYTILKSVQWLELRRLIPEDVAFDEPR